jgi:hypothetical protein
MKQLLIKINNQLQEIIEHEIRVKKLNSDFTILGYKLKFEYGWWVDRGEGFEFVGEESELSKLIKYK